MVAFLRVEKVINIPASPTRASQGGSTTRGGANGWHSEVAKGVYDRICDH